MMALFLGPLTPIVLFLIPLLVIALLIYVFYRLIK